MIEWLNNNVILLLGLVITLISVSLAADLPFYFGFSIFTQQALGIIIGLALAITFIRFPFVGKQKSNLPIYDIVLAFISIIIGIYIAFRYPTVSAEFFARREEAFIIGVILIPLVIDALRRTTGLGLVIILFIFLIYGLFAHLVPGQLNGRSQSLYKLFAYLGTDLNALFGTPLIIITTIVILFILFGQILLKSGGSEWFTDLAISITGNSRGGSAKIAIVASALFGSISGSAVSNVASTGVLTIPLMKKGGYKPVAAGAFEAVASTGGQIMPPIMGAAAFLMAERLDLPYSEIVLASLIPAILFYIGVFIQADIEAEKQKIPPVSPDRIIPLFKVIKDGWFFFIPFIVLILSLFVFNRRPETSALLAIGSSITLSFIFSYKGNNLNLKKIYQCLTNTGVVAVDILIIGAMAGIIIGVVEVTGLSFGLTFVLVQLGGSNLFLLLIVTAIVSIFLGMGMPTTAIYLIVATLAAPPLVKLGVNVIAADMFVLYFGLLSMITPPVAIAAFTAANLAEANPMKTALLACKYGWPAFILPFIFVLSPNLLMEGKLSSILISGITALMGVWLISVSLSGYFKLNLNYFIRIILILCGLILLSPNSLIENIYLLKAFSIITSLLIIIIIYRKSKLMNKRSSF
ncbi:TRAP transporter fused permease subunit [Alphaproteobacteria bacterium]|nr:TRAP transporter fused permease subunit [Alphaproteobacteria bacterium]